MKQNEIKNTLSHELCEFSRSWKTSKDESYFLKNCIVCGGAIASLVLDEEPKDIDIYFRTSEALSWYIEKTYKLSMRDNFSDGGYELTYRTSTADTYAHGYNESAKKIQIIKVMPGEPDKIVQNFDFLHTMVYYDPLDNVLSLPTGPMTCILEKRLEYTQSVFPLSSLFRTRKYIRRGWKMPITEYIKIALDINKFDLSNPDVLISQLQGVDELYTSHLISEIPLIVTRSEEHPKKKPVIDLRKLNDLLDLERIIPGDLRDDLL